MKGDNTHEDIEPQAIDWTPEGDVHITWSDAHGSIYDPAYLRRICPCAECKGTHGTTPKAFRVVGASAVRGQIRQTTIKQVEPVGNYAMAFTWGDGHREGIYTWSMLRKACPCEACTLIRKVNGEAEE